MNNIARYTRDLMDGLAKDDVVEVFFNNSKNTLSPNESAARSRIVNAGNRLGVKVETIKVGSVIYGCKIKEG